MVDAVGGRIITVAAVSNRDLKREDDCPRHARERERERERKREQKYNNNNNKERSEFRDASARTRSMHESTSRPIVCLSGVVRFSKEGNFGVDKRNAKRHISFFQQVG